LDADGDDDAIAHEQHVVGDMAAHYGSNDSPAVEVTSVMDQPQVTEEADNTQQPPVRILRRSTRVTRSVHVVSGNMSVPKARREHGAAADVAVLSELTQMLSKQVFEVVPWAGVRGEQVIHSHLFLKAKRDQDGNLIKVKARLVAGGDAMDRSIYTVDKRTSPTVHQESIFMLLALAASKSLLVSSIDIEGAFLEVELRERVFMRLGSDISSILIKTQPELAERVNSAGCLVVKLKKALYGLVVASQLWYIRLSDTLVSFGLKVSPVDKCVFCGVLNGHTMYACIHVDDILVLSESAECVSVLEGLLNKAFTKANVDKSNPLTFLGMRISSTPSSIYVDMSHFECETCMSWGVTTALSVPAVHDLFVDDTSSPDLSTAQAKAYHSAAAKLLYVAKRTRPDILTAVNVCCGHVLKPREQDWARLDRVMRYLHGTVGRGVRFDKARPLQLVCYSDAAFGCHEEYKSRTGVVIVCNGGVVATKSGKQTLTTKSTPESELVALSDGATMALGCRQFFECLGETLGPVPMLEDNKTTLEYIEHGGPIHARTRYIGVKLYFTKDHVTSGELKMVYCPTKDMLADLMTKPVSGDLFASLRDRVVHVVPSC